MSGFAHRVVSFFGSDRGERGSSLVEFAFSAPLFLLLLFAVVDFGRGLFDYNLVANGARLGTRYAIVRGATCTPQSTCTATQSSIASYVTSVSPGVTPTDLTVSVAWSNTVICPLTSATGATVYPGGNGPGCTVSVTVSYPFKFAALAYSPVTLKSTSTMTISQ